MQLHGTSFAQGSGLMAGILTEILLGADLVAVVVAEFRILVIDAGHVQHLVGMGLLQT